MGGKFRLMIVVLGVCVCTGNVHAAIKKGPYLIYPGNNTQMTVLWQTDVTQSCTLQWGLNTSYSAGNVNTTEYGTDHQHKYTLTGLSTGVKYYYRVIIGGSYYTGSFISAPAASATAVKFFTYGDTRTYPADHNTVCAGMANACAGDPAYQTFSLHVGDWNGSCDTDTYWGNEFFNRAYPNTLAMQANLPINGCVGNHEWCSSPNYATYYQKYYPYPYVSGLYWSFDYGPAHVAVVDQYSMSYGVGSAQYNWLVNDLANSTKEWKFIVLHEPGYSAGGHTNNTTVQTVIQPLCETYGVDIVFAGHNHYYSRNGVNGVKHLTIGGGGAPTYNADPAYPYVEVCAKTFHFCMIAINGPQLDCTVLKPDGTLVDSFTLSHALSAAIDEPANGASVFYGDPVTLTGSADYGTPPYTYIWESNVDGDLGTGASINVSDLSVHKVGTAVQPHTITLTVQDADLNTVTSQIQLTVRFRSDFEPDGDLDLNDFEVFSENWRRESAMPTNAKGWWKLDETSGTAAVDSSGSNYTGTLINMSSSAWVAGRYGNALDFDGSNDYVTLPRNTVLETGNAATKQLTASAWIKHDSLTPPTTFTTIVGTGDGGWYIGSFPNENKLVFACWLTSGYLAVVTDNTPVFDGQWHHVIGVYDGSKAHLYVDGNHGEASYPSGTIMSPNKAVLFGENAGATGRYWNGLIDDVRIYDYVALEQANIADFNKDGVVNLSDLSELIEDWLESGI